MHIRRWLATPFPQANVQSRTNYQTGSAPRSRALLVVNANSRNGKECLPELQDQLRAAGIRPMCLSPSGRDEVAREIATLAPQADCILAAGGDGTVNAVAESVLDHGLPLGIIPLGTANDLARTLGIPVDPASAIDVIAAGHTRRIDVGLVNGRPFFNVASLGLSSELAKELTKEVKRRFGRLGYALAAIRVLSRAKPFVASVTSDHGVITARTLQVAIGNGRYYGGGNVVAEDAAIDDGQLDLYSLEFYRAWKLAFLARSFRQGTHGQEDGVRAMAGRTFLVHTRRPLPVNADGEIVTHTPARFEVLPKKIAVFAPADVPPEAGLSTST